MFRAAFLHIIRSNTNKIGIRCICWFYLQGVCVYVYNLCHKSVSHSLHHGFPTRGTPGCRMRPAAHGKIVYILQKFHINLGGFLYHLLFFHVPPANQLTIMGVAFCHKMVGGPKLAKGCNRLSWSRYIEVGLCLHSYVFLFRLACVPII